MAIPTLDKMSVTDTLPGRETEFRIGSPKWVMRALADLYSDITTAIIREYSTNAYDAHVMGGNTAPIEITLPSTMNPYFIVKDYGVGMDEDTMHDLYTSFGDSDKRTNADANGMLGFGCKSGMAYTNSFSITSIKDGVKVSGVVSKKPDWSISLKTLPPVLTDEPNGTEIKILIHNIDEFCHKAYEFYKFWLPGRVLVNGVEPDHAVGDQITDNFYFSTHWDRSYVVMGNVPYRIENPGALFNDLDMNRINFVAYVDNGDVEFSNSREDLKYTDHTKASLSQIIKNFEKEIFAAAKRETENTQSHAEAYKVWSKWTKALGTQMFTDLTFNGDRFVNNFTIDAFRYDTSRSRGSTHRINTWYVEHMEHTMVVHGRPSHISPSSDHKSKAKTYAMQQGWGRPRYILFADDVSKVTTPWITKDRFVDWETIKAAMPKKAPMPRSASTGPRRISGTFDFITSSGREDEKHLPNDTSSGLFYIALQDAKRYDVKEILLALDSKATVVILPANRMAKFTRENPDVEEFMKYARARVVLDGPSLLSDDDKVAMSISGSLREWVRRLDATKVDDPEVVRLIGLLKHQSSSGYQRNLTLARWTGQVYNVKKYEPAPIRWFYKRYPLLQRLSHYISEMDHLYMYMNAAYAAEKENNND